jgi:hypothetical protein
MNRNAAASEKLLQRQVSLFWSAVQEQNPLGARTAWRIDATLVNPPNAVPAIPGHGLAALALLLTAIATRTLTRVRSVRRV